jgi:uncharacterized membrane protein YjfL (UPF0719 family)
MKLKLFVAFILAAVMPSGIALAQDAPGTSNALAVLSLLSLLSTLVYGVIGIILVVLGYFVFDRLLKLDLRRELVEDQNTALGIMLAGVFIGISIVVASVMLS